MTTHRFTRTAELSIPTRTYHCTIVARTGSGQSGTAIVCGNDEEDPTLYRRAVAEYYGPGHFFAHDSGLAPHYGHVAWNTEDGATVSLGRAIRVDAKPTTPVQLHHAWGDALPFATAITLDYTTSQGERRSAVYSGDDVRIRAVRGLQEIRRRNGHSVRATASWRDGEITRTVDLGEDD